ncbi:hypothetical protein G6F59_016369 [Rhizopus arrhizus]|nr:hypothetical protein G6F59_016369 [Rhizopus arrhizus]
MTQIAIVQQDLVLFHRTLAENIAYARPGATQAEIEQAARLASAHDFIMSLPKGYDTLVGERGVKLSGGERQRVAIARALAMQPLALLCDEITSALDPELVNEVLAVVRELAADGMTLLMVTHEMRFAREVCDRVVFMHQGRVHEIGPPEELFSAPATPELRQFLGITHLAA